MAVPVRRQVQIWGAVAAVLVLLLWFLGDVVLPFVLGAAVAYFLDPVADALERLGLGRTTATVLISLVAVSLFLLATLLLVPLLAQQTQSLIAALPRLTETLTTILTERFPSLVDADSTLRQSLRGLGEALQSRAGELANAVLGSALSVINLAMLVVVVPVVAFYMLVDWDKMIARLDNLLPRDHRRTIRAIMRDIDDALAGFIRGQTFVCIILGAFYAIGLSLLGLNFGLLIGLGAGLVSFIPYVGSLSGFLVSVIVALVQFWPDWTMVAAVMAVFFAGQALEGNVLQPKLVGGHVGLHPVWLMLALFAFGYLFGFVGMLLAVPVAAAIGVVTRFAIARYLESPLYFGEGGRDDSGEAPDA